MKRKLLLTILGAATAVTMAFGIAACGDNFNPDTEHTHTFSEAWSISETEHWHAATCGHTSATKDKAAHTYEEDVCTVCGYETNKAPDNQGNGQEHTHTYTAENVCGECGEAWIYTEGLEYGLDEETDTYAVIGIGTVTETEITIPYGYEGKFVTSIGDLAFAPVDMETREIFESYITSIVIPDSVTSLGMGAIAYCSALESIVIPDNVTTLGDSAFEGCSSLVSVIISNSVTTIGHGTFVLCSSLESIVIPDSVTAIEDHAFFYCTGLTNIVIPDSVTSIGDYAFWLCSSLEGVVIGGGVTSIGEAAFFECIGLISITIPDGVTSIGDHAFASCTSLTSVMIPDSVTVIGEWTFYNCISLESIVIPDSVTSIGRWAFEDCSGLTSVYYKGTAQDWNQISIDSSNDPLTNTTRYYYSEEPNYDGAHWHYDVDMVPTVWAREGLTKGIHAFPLRGRCPLGDG